MLILLALPVMVVVAAGHHNLQRCAPSNLLARRVRVEPPTLRMFAALLALAAALLIATETLSSAVASGAPGCLNLVLLVLAWDAIKVALLAAHTGLRALVRAARRTFGPLGRPLPARS
jgi:hypothetical protein